MYTVLGSYPATFQKICMSLVVVPPPGVGEISTSLEFRPKVVIERVAVAGRTVKVRVAALARARKLEVTETFLTWLCGMHCDSGNENWRNLESGDRE